MLTALGADPLHVRVCRACPPNGRAQQSARAISQVAVRLAEPETMAGEHVANLSQAIRRELTSMGDGVERALARAAELETRVRSEVSTLERSYSDNERKIRLLIAEMADQRESIVTSGTRVRDAITIAHDAIAEHLDSHGSKLSERINDTGQRLSASLGASSEDIALALDRTGSATLERIVAEGARMSVSIAGIGESLAERLADTSQKAAGDILARVGEVDNRFRAIGENLLHRVGDRGDDLIERIESRRTPSSRLSTRTATGSQRVLRTRPSSREAPLALTPTTWSAASPAAARERLRRSRDMEKRSRINSTEASRTLSVAFGAQGEGIVDRISESGAEVLEAIRAHGDSVSNRLSEAELRPATPSPPTRDLVSRISTSSARPPRRSRRMATGSRRACPRQPKQSTRRATWSPTQLAGRRPSWAAQSAARGRCRRPRKRKRSASCRCDPASWRLGRRPACRGFARDERLRGRVCGRGRWPRQRERSANR